MLEVAAEHKQLITTHHTNPAHLYGGHVTFSHFSMSLPSLSNVLPAMILQNKVVKPSMHLLDFLSHSKSDHISLGLGLSVPSCLRKVVMVVVLLLLLSGDVETNPGPVGEHITKI